MSNRDEDELSDAAYVSARSDDSSEADDDGASSISSTSQVSEVDDAVVHDHAYLGDDVGIERPHSAYYEPGAVVDLPLVVLPDIVIFPGETLPLRMLSSATIQLITLRTRLRQEFDTFAVISTLHDPIGTVGTIIQIERIYEQNDVHLSIVGRGCQRFELCRIAHGSDDYATLAASVRVRPDYHALRVPFAQKRAAFGYWRPSEYNLFDGHVLVRKAKAMLATSVEWRGVNALVVDDAHAAPDDPTQFSYWLAAHVHLSVDERRALLRVDCTVRRLHDLLTWLHDHTSSSIACRTCRTLLAQSTDIFSTQRAGTFVNPGGHVHQILTLYSVQSEQIVCVGRPTTRDTWFRGYSWQCMYCGTCDEFIGWRYASKRQTPHVFYGLVRTAIR
ncbi:hypothetical protein SDRG_10652 [Saprolegnia diclina VS20]|uniref:Protein cereblon n=1 Tax=Saprolegnia diclina (strain VS20) TaxID=1156394 RepID=T0QA23_SAPDV|nr:hypothetical protein SDRG_10652 [Saprolegnia diclina VS20]EQC31476.1 hypothetical protein SDRG_10652 [Saprolegnia diclina VS20]|eukprot:XP_008614875.1 hypothetical protein SDRG_10652 [Saprolegnia diclina VS20]